MKRLVILAVLLSCSYQAVIAQAPTGAAKPNIVFILADLKTKLHERLAELGDADPIATETKFAGGGGKTGKGEKKGRKKKKAK